MLTIMLSKKWILIAAAVVILAVVAAPVWAANSHNSKLAEKLSEILGYPDVATLRAALGWDPGPKCADSSGTIDADCLGLELGNQGATVPITSGEDLAAAWGTTEEALEDALQEAGGDLQKLAQLLGFTDAKALAAAVGLEDEDKLAAAFGTAAAKTEAEQSAAETGEETPVQTGDTSTQAGETPAVQNEVVQTEVEQEAESGDVEMGFSVENTGDYSSQCAPVVQAANTGNFNNAPIFNQYASEAGDFEPGGISFEVSPELAVQCEQEIQQAAAASG
jgi:hypothetical protein